MKDEDQTWCILMIRGLEAERKALSRIGVCLLLQYL